MTAYEYLLLGIVLCSFGVLGLIISQVIIYIKEKKYK